MTVTQPKPTTIQEWLVYIEALHPKSIAMGLDRVQAVATKLSLVPSFPIITVAGTNGKGSTCEMLRRIYSEAGYKVGCYTSPHLIRYNERVRVNHQEISDQDLCMAFEAVETARGDIALTYFEMGTLAAMWYFCRANLDVVILEVGLGGRLDAVNIFEPACAIVTTVDLDHMEYLGETREKIGFEKAGVFRANKLAICGDENPPASLLNYAETIGADLKLINRDFQVKKNKQGWQYSEKSLVLQLPVLGLAGEFQLANAACAICTVHHLKHIIPVSQANIHAALGAVRLTGRFQQVQSKPQIIVDVAHNPHAATSLAQNLQSTPCAGRTLAVFAMLADKDIEGVISAVTPCISRWYIADIRAARGAKALNLQKTLIRQVDQASVRVFDDVSLALAAACKDADKNDRIIAFGSFYTVADAISWVSARAD
ncbi:MAG: bifunctional tetrahydrofolate synthase/dihydrofolate synthase [Methylotenera sp.]